MAPLSIRLALAAILALAFALRAHQFGRVFLEDGVVAFVVGDPYYHLRLAEYALARFPATLAFDPYVAFPGGAAVPWPPLYDLWVAGSAWLVGGSARSLEGAAAWWPPVFGALTTLPVYAIARMLRGPACGLAAALVFALIPVSISLSRVGYADHHAAVVGGAVVLLAIQTSLLRGAGSSACRALLLAAMLGLVRAALMLSWGGALLDMGIADIAFVLVATAYGARRALAIEAASLAVSALVTIPSVRVATEAGIPSFTPLALSWLTVAASAALALWSGGTALFRRPAATGLRSLAACIGLGGLLAVLLVVAVPGLADQLIHLASLAGKEDVWASANAEQRPLLGAPGGPLVALSLLGGLAWLIPAVPIALGLLAWREHPSAGLALLAAWCATFGALALGHVRFAHDYAPLGAVAVAVLAGWAGARLADRWSLRGAWRAAPALALVAFVLAPTVPLYHAPQLRASLAGTHHDRSPEATLVRFAREVRRATPETAGYMKADAQPEYGILCDPSLGHVLHYVGRRATLSDNFGPYVGDEERFLLGLRLLLTRPTSATVPTLDELGLRYVVTSWQPRYRARSLLLQLHEHDGRSFDAAPALSNFRLVAEAPRGGLPLEALLGTAPPRGAVPYKLFEVVPGAVLDLQTAPGASLRAAVTVETGDGRRFVHAVSGHADESGRGELRVPYATDGSAGGGTVRVLGPYRVRADGQERAIRVSESDVRQGRRIRIELPEAKV